MRYTDITGNVYGRLKVLNFVGTDRLRNALWLCLCECGTEKIIQGSSLRLNQTKSCGCLQRDIIKRLNTKEEFEASKQKIFNNYRNNAKTRGLEFTLDKEYFLSLIEKNCYYCDSEPSQRINVEGMNGIYTYNGVDRVDNERGYTLENCITCCKICNRAKREISQYEFEIYLKRIAKKYGSI